MDVFKKHLSMRKGEFYLDIAKIILVSAFFYNILRAYYLSITYDEALTYLWYVTKSYIGIFVENPTANNHFLNTILVKFFINIFGVSEFIVRIPALIGAAFYLTGVYYISKLLFYQTNDNGSRYKQNGYYDKNKKYFLISVLLLSTNPLVMDFLSLSRGYSLALGFLMIAIYYFLKDTADSKGRMRVNAIIVVMCSLSVLSILSFIYIYAAIILLLAFREIRQYKSVKNLFLPVLLSTTFLTLVLSNQIISMRNKKEFFYGGDVSFWHDTVKSLIDYTLYKNTYSINKYFDTAPSIGVIISQIIIISLIVIFLSTIIYNIYARQFGANIIGRRLLSISSLLFLLIILINIHHCVLNDKFVIDRGAIFFIPIFLLFMMLLWRCASKVNPGASKITDIFFSIIVLLLLINFIQSINLSYTLEWKYESTIKESMDEIMKDNIGKNLSNDSRSIGLTWFYDSSINFYRVKYNLYWLKAASTSGPDGLFDYYIVDNDWVIKDKYVLRKYNVSYVKYYALSNSYFAKRMNQ